MRKRKENGSYIEIKGSNGIYKRMNVVRNGKVRNFAFHSLVAEHFLGKKPSDKHVIDHVDRDKYNNHINNLRYATHQENNRNSDKFKNYIFETWTTEGKPRFKVKLNHLGKNYRKTFNTKVEAEEWIVKKEYTDARNIASHGEGHMHIYFSVENIPKYRPMIHRQGKLYTKTFDSKEDAQEWLKHMRSTNDLPVSTRRPRGNGHVSVRKTKNGQERFDAKVFIDNKQHNKTFHTKEEAEEWLASLVNKLM